MMELENFWVSLKFRVFFVFLLSFFSCKKEILKDFYSEYYNFYANAEYISESGESGFVYLVKDTITSEGEFKKFIFLDEIKLLRKDKNILYELRKVEYGLEDLQIDEFIVFFLDIFPIKGEFKSFIFKDFYVLGNDTLFFYYERRLKTSALEDGMKVKIENIEIKNFKGLFEKKEDSLIMVLEPKNLPLIIKKGNKIWRRKK
ncbi:MAG: hypothetical protein ABDH49_07685 [Candidatus Hydrothermales bacterium]